MKIVDKISWWLNRKQNIKKLCRVNYLSEKQEIEAYDNFGKDNLRNILENLQNNPDCEYLAQVLRPELNDTSARKNIKPENVVKATILGDIIGSKYEFQLYDYSRMKSVQLPAVSSRFTDDTVLSIATMNAILKDSVSPDFATEYKAAYHAHPHAGYGSGFVKWATDTTITEGYHSMANGSMMRISFIPAYYDNIDDVIKHTIASAMTTHNHVEGIKGAVVIAVCIWMALHGYSKNDIWKYCKKHYHVVDKNLLLNKKYYYDVTTPFKCNPLPQNRDTLFCSYVTPYVVQCFCETNSYEECMRTFLGRFGDTDTLCAIAGGLCYAFYGDTGFDIDNILQEHDVVL